MGMIDRVKNILLTPKTEWPVIEGEASTTQGLLLNYAAPLAAIGAVAGFVSGSLIGTTVPFVGITVRTPIIMGVVGAIVALVLGLAMVFVLSLIIDALAPSFGAEKNPAKALKVAVYSMTAAWIAGILQILPWIGILFALAGALYSIYLLYTGLQSLMHSPEDKVIGYTAVVIICAIVISVVMGLVVGGITAVGAGVGALGSAATSSPSANVTFDKGSPMAKLEQFGKNMEETNKKMEAAKASGNPQEAAAIAMAGLGAAMNGGKNVEALDSATLKAFVPETFAGLAKTSSKSEKTNALGMAVSTAEASYGDGSGKNINLEISDTGSAAGFLAMAGIVKVEGEKEDANGSEKNYKANGRMIHERSSKTGGSNEYSVVLGERFTVKAKGRGITLGDVKSAVNSLDLNKLEGMKNAGVTAAK